MYMYVTKYELQRIRTTAISPNSQNLEGIATPSTSDRPAPCLHSKSPPLHLDNRTVAQLPPRWTRRPRLRLRLLHAQRSSPRPRRRRVRLLDPPLLLLLARARMRQRHRALRRRVPTTLTADGDTAWSRGRRSERVTRRLERGGPAGCGVVEAKALRELYVVIVVVLIFFDHRSFERSASTSTGSSLHSGPRMRLRVQELLTRALVVAIELCLHGRRCLKLLVRVGRESGGAVFVAPIKVEQPLYVLLFLVRLTDGVRLLLLFLNLSFILFDFLFDFLLDFLVLFDFLILLVFLAPFLVVRRNGVRTTRRAKTIWALREGLRSRSRLRLLPLRRRHSP
ncbi:hypothetical protein OH76DRAFT_258597 [Lentinus brumalis]|uniref:Uncharacterized protein n=1 Tax=Lentinus brumalis TaxID=2498619 RepID=A0A371CL75_9APHY|nr:hypothetical protein OH76DRAFT_258597 [Polyporus brumalis]